MFETTTWLSRRTVGPVAALLTVVVAVALLAWPSAAVDAAAEPTTSLFVKFDGVAGESVDADHRGWSDATSFNQAEYVGPNVIGLSRRSPQPVAETFLLTKPLDKADLKLQEALVTGRVFALVELDLTSTFTDAGRVAFYQYKLTDVLVTSYNIGTSGQDEVTRSDLPRIASPEAALGIPVAEIGLQFEEIKVTYTEIDGAGRIRGRVEWIWKPGSGR